MYFFAKNECIDYDYFGGKTENVIFLHGWGGNKKSFLSTINLLKHKYNVLAISLPTTQPTVSIWNMNDYAEVVINLMQIHNIKNPIIIAHSFGFRVTAILNLKQIKFKKIIVTGGAGIKKKNSFFQKIIKNNQKILLKQHKFQYLFKHIASNDYLSLSKINRESFKNIVNLNTYPIIKFNCPILLFWGKNDNETPLKHAKIIKNNNNARLIVVNSGHFAYLDENSLFNYEVLEFIK